MVILIHVEVTDELNMEFTAIDTRYLYTAADIKSLIHTSTGTTSTTDFIPLKEQ